MKHIKGFTLIELIFAVAIVAILAAVALPAYSNYVVRSKLSEAFAGLDEQRLRMEQYFADNRNYGTAGGACGAANSTSSYFTFTCVAGNPATTYTITATSIANVGLGAAGAYAYTINEAGTKNTTAFAGGAGVNGSWKSK